MPATAGAHVTGAADIPGACRALMDALDDGFCVIEVIVDADGTAVDYRFLQANAAFEAQTGLAGAVGRRMRELAPAHDAQGFEVYGRVARTGIAERFEQRADALDRCYEVHAFPVGGPGQRRVGILFRDAEQRRIAGTAARGSEVRYQSLFERMQDGFCICEQVSSDPVDFRYLVANPAFERHAGQAPAGRTMRELVPGVEESIMSTYARVAETGRPESFTTYVRVLDRWFEIEADAADRPGRIAVTFRDVTARERAQAALRASEDRKTFLLALGDALRAVSGTDALIEVAARRLGERLGASRVLFAEFDEDRGVAHVFSGWSVSGAAPFPTSMRLAGYEGAVLDDLRAGRVVRVDDTADPALARPDLAAIARVGVGALLSIPLQVAGRLAVNLSVHQFDARAWTDDDVAIAQDVAERVWAEVVRARAQAAMRESDARRLAMADAAPALVWETDARGATYVNRHYLEFFGVDFDAVAGMGWAKFVHPDDLDAYSRAYLLAFRERRPLEYDVRLLRADGGYRWTRVTGQPLGEDRFVGLCIDITDVRDAAEQLAAERERHVFLLELGDALREAPDADALVERALRMLHDHLGLDRCYVGVYGLEDDRADFPYQVARAGLPRLPEGIRLSDFPEAFKVALERTLVIDDAAQDPALSELDRRSIAGLGFGALVAATLRRGPGRPLWAIVAVSSTPRAWTHTEVALLEEATERTWLAMERARTQSALGESEERLRIGAEVAHFAMWDWNVATGQVTWSDEHFRMQGYAVGEVVPSYAAWAARVHPDDLAATEAALAHARDTRTEFAREFRSLHPDGSVHWLSARGRFFFDEAGEPVRMIGAMLDTTERRQWEDRQQVLVAELQHRTRNIMGVVRAMFERTRRDSPDMATLHAKYGDRLNALARVQGLLSRLDEGDRITFDELIQAELSAMGAVDAQGQGARVALSGPRGVRMRSSTVQTFALALHELATNAAKYGALAQPDGRLDVRWRVEPAPGSPRLCIEWIESGVEMPPAGATPRGGGYGRELIERALPYQLDARTHYELGPDGVRCTIEVPVPERRLGARTP